MKGMKYWKGMTDDEREEVKLHVKKNNLDLDITEAVLTDLSVFVHKVRTIHALCFILINSFFRSIFPRHKENFYQLHKY